VGRPNGELLDIRWDGNTWSAPKLIEEKTDPTVSLALDSNQRAVLVWQDRETQGLKMSFLEPGADDWTQVGEVVTLAQARQVRVLPLVKDGSIKYLLVWNTGGAMSTIESVWIDYNGTPLSKPMLLTLDSDGSFSDLQLRPGTDYEATITAQHETDGISIREIITSLFTSDDCNGNGITDALDIESGFAQDCNQNGVPDFCDIRYGDSSDRNLNGVPDECENEFDEDCNGNGLTDQDEAFLGLVTDQNGNGIPDDCEPVPLPQLIQIRRDNAPDAYLIRISGPSGEIKTLIIQKSTDLEQWSDWKVLDSFPIEFSDPGSGPPYRVFYRVVEP
jgi:hypothetical protein